MSTTSQFGTHSGLCYIVQRLYSLFFSRPHFARGRGESRSPGVPTGVHIAFERTARAFEGSPEPPLRLSCAPWSAVLWACLKGSYLNVYPVRKKGERPSIATEGACLTARKALSLRVIWFSSLFTCIPGMCLSFVYWCVCLCVRPDCLFVCLVPLSYRFYRALFAAFGIRSQQDLHIASTTYQSRSSTTALGPHAREAYLAEGRPDIGTPPSTPTSEMDRATAVCIYCPCEALLQ